VASGPVEYLVIKFAEVVAGEIIHVIDFIFIQKDQGGNLRVMELNEMDYEAACVFDPLVDDITRLLSSEDIEKLSEALENNSAAAIVLIEHTWATRLRDAVVNAGGELMADGLIPREVVELVLDDNDKSNV
jgi:Family of unknown function (DUF6325)